MSDLAAATESFLSAVATHRSLQELQEATAKFHRAIPTATRTEIDAALQSFLPVVRTAQLVPVSTVVITGGALVEFGGDPMICGETILDRLPQLLRGTAAFLRDVLRRAAVQEHEQPDFDQIINLHINDILDANPELAWAYIARQSLSLGAITHLSKSKQLRAIARSRPELLSLSRETDTITGTTSFLTDILHVLDDERLIVLHPEEKKGYEVRIAGIADNFQLQTLLAESLIGDVDAGWLTGKKPEPAVVAAARDTVVPAESRLQATGAFNLWSWPALRADGTLPEAQKQTAWWIWNEGNPGDVQPFEGVRVVLLGPPPYPRSWNAGRRFTSMTGEFAVEQVLTPEAVREWLARLAAAPKPVAPPV